MHTLPPSPFNARLTDPLTSGRVRKGREPPLQALTPGLFPSCLISFGLIIAGEGEATTETLGASTNECSRSSVRRYRPVQNRSYRSEGVTCHSMHLIISSAARGLGFVGGSCLVEKRVARYWIRKVDMYEPQNLWVPDSMRAKACNCILTR